MGYNMVDIIKNVIRMFAVIILIIFLDSYSYSQNNRFVPTDDMFKQSIAKILLEQDYLDYNIYKNNIKYNKFQITHSFFKKDKDGVDRYCVEVDYDLNLTYKYAYEIKTVIKTGKGEKWSFKSFPYYYFICKGWEMEP